MAPYDPDRHHRRSIRLRGYDYTQPGAYFVTICAYDREPLFGEVVDGEMRVNKWGEIVREEWFRTTQLRPYVVLYDDEFVVMPNHIHG
ncbi:MAG: transposase, partial [Thermoflexia bacterium]